MPRRLNILDRHHQRLLEIISTARPLLTSSPEETDLNALRHLRREMIEGLAAYQRFVHEDIFEPSMNLQAEQARRDATDLKVDCIRLQQDYDTFGLRWAHREALANWTEYRLSAIRMMKQVRDHIYETQELQKTWAGPIVNVAKG